MGFSSTCDTLLKRGYGYRNDDLFENINKPFLEVITFEVEELGNTDIIECVYENYLLKESRLPFHLQNLVDTILRNKKDTDLVFTEILSEEERKQAYSLINEYFCRKLGYKGNTNLYCKWLTTKRGYKLNYFTELDGDYTLTKYGFKYKHCMIASDLGTYGSLIVMLEPFEKLESHFYKNGKHMGTC